MLSSDESIEDEDVDAGLSFDMMNTTLQPHEDASKQNSNENALEAWIQEHTESGSPYNDNYEISKRVYMATKSTKVDLSKMGLREPLPSEVYTIRHIKQMFLNDNNLLKVSPLIGCPRMEHLIQLNLENNCLVEIPASIGNLTNLVFASLHKNQIRAVPDTLVSLTKLQRMTLYDNQIEKLPDTFYLLKHVKEISFLDNPLQYPRVTWQVEYDGKFFISLYKLREALKSSGATKHSMYTKEEEVVSAARTRLFDYLERLQTSRSTKSLSLDDLGLSRIPEEVLLLTFLTDLSLARNVITSIPPKIRNLGNSLVKLDLSYNRLSSLPMDLRFLTRLDVCDLSGMDMEFVPKVIMIAGIKNVRRYVDSLHLARDSGMLDLSGMKLSHIPDDVYLMTNLTELRLNDNLISHVPPRISVLENLKNIFLDSNPLKNLPQEFERLGKMERISLLGCPIREFPLELCRMKSLREIRSFSHNLVSKDSERISSEVVIRNTQNLMEQFRYMITAYETNSLILSDMSLVYFPIEAFYITNLTTLDISMNDFVFVPNFMGNLQNLKTLRLDFNLFSALSFDWSSMELLESLHLEHNQLEEPLSETFGRMTSLQELIANNNKISQLPSSMSGCVNLTTLVLSFNNIVELPMLSYCSRLRYVDLRHNRLSQVPAMSLARASKLQFLDLSFNVIVSFPPCGFIDLDRYTKGTQELEEFHLDKLISMHYSGEQKLIEVGQQHQPLMWGEELKSLRLHGNRITVLPWDLCCLTSIEDLSYDPEMIFIPTQEVVIRGWGLVRSYLRRWFDSSRFSDLNLSSFNLLFVPLEVLLHSSLTRLDLSHNRLSGTLDPNLSLLVSLRELDVSNNLLVDLSDKLLFLTNLCDGWQLGDPLDSKEAELARGGLRWHNNRWRSPPLPVRLKGTRYIFQFVHMFHQIPHSRRLALNGMDLRHFPYDILCFTSLTCLDLSDNNLSVLPPSLVRLVHLQELLVQKNKISYVHPDLGSLRRLELLDVQDNHLEILPHELCLIASLSSILYSGNNMGGPPEGLKVRPEALLQQVKEEGGSSWMEEIISSGALPDATVVYLRNFLTARGNAKLGVPAGLHLDLRCLSMTFLPREVSDLVWSSSMHKNEDMTSLTHLSFDGNPLADLPAQVRGWTHVRSISLNNCLLRSLPDCIADSSLLPHLATLEANDNALRVFPLFDGCWESLTHLYLDRNEFTALPPRFGSLTSLRVLSLRRNKLDTLPPSFWRLKLLVLLRLEGNNLQRLPPELGALSCSFPPLEEIEMREHLLRGGPLLDYVLRPPGSPLPKLPEDMKGKSEWQKFVGGMRKEGESEYGRMQLLQAEDNERIWSPPPEVIERGGRVVSRYLRALFDCRHSNSLDLHDFSLLRLPPETLEFAWSLQSLWLSYNHLETLPVCIEELTALKTLHLHHNRIDRLPPTLGLCLLQLTDLDISHNRMSKIPLEFANLKSLERFNIRDNPWEMIPEELVDISIHLLLKFLQNLKESVHGELDMRDFGLTTKGMMYVRRGLPEPLLVHTALFDGNSITRIPKSFHVLTNLTRLSLEKNQLDRLPDWIPMLQQLVFLSVSKNRLQEVESSLSECSKLEKLFLDSNFIRFLPTSLGSLRHLSVLRLDCNKLLVVNPSLSFVSSLIRLWLPLTETTMLPPELCYLTNLRELKLDNSPLKSPPTEVLVGGCQNVLSYLSKLQAGKEASQIDISGFSLLAVPFEVTYFSNLTRLVLDNNRLKTLWPVTPTPHPTERDKAVIVGGGKLAYRHIGTPKGRTPHWEEPLDPLRLVGPYDELPTPSIDRYPVHFLGNLVNLQSLSAKNNVISELPAKCFPRWQTCLRELFLDNNQISILPFEMHTLDMLQSFTINGNNLKHPPVDFQTEGFPTLRKYWKRIATSEHTGICELANMSLLLFPTEFVDDPRFSYNIKYLDLSGNQITTINPRIHNMTALETLHLERNSIDRLPDTLFHCTNLTELCVDDNKLLEVNKSIGNCSRIISLSLNGNRLENIPEELGRLTGMTKLALGNNRLKLGTAWWLAGLISLESLWLFGNQISAIPVVIGMLTRLDDLRLHNNPLKDPPKNIIVGGIKSIRDYLSYNIVYEFDQSALAPPRTKKNVDNAKLMAKKQEVQNAARHCEYQVTSTAPTDARGAYHFGNALDGGANRSTFWMSSPGVDSVVVEVNLGTKFSLQRIELHWRSNFSARCYTVQLSEEGRQWFLVHRGVSMEESEEGKVKEEEEHVTHVYAAYGTDRVDTIMLRDESSMMIRSALPSTGVQWVRVQMTRRWFNSYRLNQLYAWGDRVEGASFVTGAGEDGTLSFKDA